MIGELNIHTYNCKEGQAKPSFLDMAEVIIASCPGQTGIKKNAIFEVRNITMHVSSFMLKLLPFRDCRRITQNS